MRTGHIHLTALLLAPLAALSANLHFTPEGSKLTGGQIAARILEALGAN